MYIYMYIRQVARANSKSGAVVKLERVFVVNKTTLNVKCHFKSSAAPLYRSLVTSLYMYNTVSAHVDSIKINSNVYSKHLNN